MILDQDNLTETNVFTGALMWWGPKFAFYGAKAAAGNVPESKDINPANVAFKFGIVMTLAGLIGVPLGSYVAQTLRHRIPNADPIVCGASLLMAVPVLYFGFIAARYALSWCYALTFLAGKILNSQAISTLPSGIVLHIYTFYLQAYFSTATGQLSVTLPYT